MNFADYALNAVRRVNRLWQLVIAELLALGVNMVLFLLIFLLPMIIAALAFGLPLAEYFDKGAEGLSKIGSGELGLIIGFLAVACLFALVYIAAAIAVYSFARAAVLGVIADDTADAEAEFSVTSLISSGKRHFRRVLNYTLMTAAIEVLALIVFGLAVALILIVYDAIGEGTTSAIVFAVASGITVAGIAIVLSFIWMVIYAQGIAPLMLRQTWARASLRQAVEFIESQKGAFGFTLLAYLAVLVIQIGVLLVGVSIRLVPIVGPIIYMPFNLLSKLISIYTMLCLNAAVMEYYYLNKIWPEQFAGEDEILATLGEASSQQSDTSFQ